MYKINAWALIGIYDIYFHNYTYLKGDTAVCGVTSLLKSCRKHLSHVKHLSYLESTDLSRFQQEGGNNLKKTKFYNNVIAPRFFELPLDQVSLIQLLCHSTKSFMFTTTYIHCWTGVCSRLAHQSRHFLQTVHYAGRFCSQHRCFNGNWAE